MSGTPIRLGVVGLGRAFTLMLPTFLGDRRVQLAGACDPRAAAREQFSRDFAAPAYATLDELARDPSIEALYIASPHQFHAEHTRIAAMHGKHVLLEKPMALSLDECDAMIAQCREAGVRMIVGHCHSFDAPYLRTRALIDTGEFGRVRMIHAINYTDFLYRPRRPEELKTAEGGGVVFSQAAHQVDVVRLLAGSEVVRVRAVTGAWDRERDTEGAYSVLLWFASGAFASLTYSGYGHFDSDEWTGWVGEMGQAKNPADHGGARRRLMRIGNADEEARLKNEGTYGGPSYKPPDSAAPASYQHFGPVIVSCEGGDLRPVPDGVWIHGHETKRHEALPPPAVPRSEVIDELVAVLRDGRPALHDGPWARATLQVCLAMLESARRDREVPAELMSMRTAAT
ncbi:Gfo/Idh/MocA family protein [Ramlibacter sp.]|uniref:Gfo/Idh/MocA family protein n=1 Tax=Ramlibacter sp. TaxID=1917967 RepID=UPI003D0C23E3